MGSSYRIKGDRGEVSINAYWDWSQYDAAVKEMDRTASEIIAKAIADVLRAQMSKTQRKIMSDTPPSQQDMAIAVADSLMVESGHRDKTAEVRFGSDPMDAGGVTGSRGGKLAQYLEYGVRPFKYGFTFKTIENTRFWGSDGGGFINAEENMLHGGFKAIGWLTDAQEKTIPKMDKAILDALHNAWGF
jgi:hypothetical protein